MDPELQKDLQFFGGSMDCLPAWMREAHVEQFEVLLDNVSAFALFHRLQTQWRTDGSRRIGLDYNVAFSLLDRQQVPAAEQIDILDRLAGIEAGYLEELNKQINRERSRIRR